MSYQHKGINMEIQVSEKESCNLSVKYTANAPEIAAMRREVLKRFKEAPVPGNRKGKASDDAVSMHYRDQINVALKQALAEQAYHNTIFEKKLRTHGAPKFNSVVLLADYFSCEFDTYVKPDFDLPQYKDIEIVKPSIDTDAVKETQAALQELRTRFGEVEPFTEADSLQEGDTAILSFSGSVDGEVLDHLKGENEMIVVGKSSLPGFDQNLLGMKVDETREFDYVAPSEGLASLAGKTVRFTINLVNASKNIPMPLDDSLAVKVGKKDFNELESFVQSVCAAKIQAKEKAALNEALSAKLIAETNVDVPSWMSVSEAQYLAHSAKLDWNTMAEEDRKQYLEVGTKNVKLSLIFDKIREEEPEAQLTDQEVFETIKQGVAKNASVSSVDDTMREMQKTGYLQILFARIKDEYVLDFISKNAKIAE